jgi:hypothetical protein
MQKQVGYSFSIPAHDPSEFFAALNHIFPEVHLSTRKKNSQHSAVNQAPTTFMRAATGAM